MRNRLATFTTGAIMSLSAATGLALACISGFARAEGGLCDGPAPSEAVTLLCSGISKQESGDTDGSIADFQRALELQPDFPEVHMMLGVSLYAKGDYPGAIERYDRYIEAVPGNFHAWSNRGAAQLQLGNLAAARSDIERALALNPGDPELLENRIVVAREAGDFLSVIQDCTTLIDLYPAKASWLLERGKALGAESRFAESLADLDRVVAMEPSAAAHYFRGVTRYFTGQYESSIKDFSQAIELDATWWSAYQKRCSARYQLQQYQEALPDCDRYVEQAPDRYDGPYTRGIVRSRAGDQDGARSDYLRAIDLARTPEERANAWYGVGLTHERAGQKADAREAYRKTLDIDPAYELARKALKRLGK